MELTLWKECWLNPKLDALSWYINHPIVDIFRLCILHSTNTEDILPWSMFLKCLLVVNLSQFLHMWDHTWKKFWIDNFPDELIDVDQKIMETTYNFEEKWRKFTHVLARLIEMSNNSSPTVATSSGFHCPWGCATPVERSVLLLNHDNFSLPIYEHLFLQILYSMKKELSKNIISDR